jgi:TolB-like protein/DNA-binding winged helix-turn-helix (wHTH) protein
MTTRTARLGGATADLDLGVIRAADGRETLLRPKSAEVLRALAARPGAVVTKEALFDAVWPGLAVVEDSLVQCVSEIRAALGEADRAALRTVPKRGYALEATPAAATPGAIRVAAARVTHSRPRRYWPVLALGAAALLATGFALRPASTTFAPPPSFDAAVAAERAAVDRLHASVLVLPFEDLSEARDLGHFADGMTEDLIAELSRWREVRVIARNSANTFKGKPVDVREAAAAMGVAYVLEGSVRRIGDGLRVTAQVVDGETGAGVWAERFDESGSDVLALQEAVIERLLHTMVGTQGIINQSDTDKAWAKAAVDLDEYDYYLRGHDLMYRYTPQDNAAAIEIWREGLRKFPASGLLTVKLGWGHLQNGRFGWVEDRDAALAEAGRLVEAGLRDPALPAAGYRFGLWLRVYVDMLHRRDYAAGVRHARTVVEAFPYDTEGLFYMAYNVMLAGERDLARGWIARALAREGQPIDVMLLMAAELAYIDGRFEDALAIGDRMANPGWRQLPVLAASLVALGRTEEARALMAPLVRSAPWLTPAALAAARPYRDPTVMPGMLARLAEAGWPPAGN